MKRLVVLVTLAAALAATTVFAQEKQDRESKVRSDKERIEAAGQWIYDDLPRGVEEAKKAGRPLLVVFRCIPCEACAKLDEDVVTRDPLVAKLLDQFVCVRIPHANGMDLSLFQFDYDQSWAAFLLNADLTIYGRYGTRSDRTHSENDVSLEGFAKALEAGLTLHARFADVRESLAGKRGAPLEVKVPEEFPSFGGRFGAALDYGKDKNVVQSCMHCHQLGEAQRRFYRDAGRPIPEKLLHPYPNPKVLGLVMDPKEKARVASVVPGSSAASDGFRAGDEITALGGQPVLSIADLQWILHGVDVAGTFQADVLRDGQPVVVTLTAPGGFRRKDDVSWRATSWDLRRMVTGGLVLEDLSDEEREKSKIDKGALALRVKHVGQYGDHATAKNAGFREGDVFVAVDGKSDRMTESELMTSLVARTKPGDKVAVTVRRGETKTDLTLPMQ